MSGIGNISNINSQSLHAPGLKPNIKPKQVKDNFSDSVRQLIENVDGDQKESAVKMSDLISGKTEDILPVVTSMAKADLSFKLLLGVRNKVMEAYKQTMNMQI